VFITASCWMRGWNCCICPMLCW